AERRIQPYSLVVREGQTERLGPFECEFFAVNHSIPDALAVAIKTGAGIVLHTGDFKMDQLPLDGRLTDLAGFARLGAQGVGLLRIPAGLVVGLDEATSLPPDRIVLMSTGSQGEPMSALGRMATGDHRHIVVEPGDTVVLASSLVPGNETAVYRVINQLSRAGATVIHKDVAKVHVSGHSPAGELLYLL